MKEEIVLTKEELEALLGESSAEKAAVSSLEKADAGSPEQMVKALSAVVQALTVKVDYLERQIKELRLQALEERRSTQAEDAAGVRRVQVPHADGRSDRQVATDRENSEVRLSRMERYGRKRKG